MNILTNKRILICGKGGSGKSSIVSLLANALQNKNYNVVLIDADASNPGGLFRLLSEEDNPPVPLIDFFGGREIVTCPVDDPSQLLRLDNNLPLSESPIEISEIPEKYSIVKNNITLFQIGKIDNAYEGCDGPMSKVSRDFIIKDDFVMLMDIEAGIEHFGRGVEKNVDVILVVVDPTYESFNIAEKIVKISSLMGKENVYAILNKVNSGETEITMKKSLRERGVKLIGSVSHDAEVQKAGLDGRMIKECKAYDEISKTINRLEEKLETLGSKKKQRYV